MWVGRRGTGRKADRVCRRKSGELGEDINKAVVLCRFPTRLRPVSPKIRE